jgi:hypothetical protein
MHLADVPPWLWIGVNSRQHVGESTRLGQIPFERCGTRALNPLQIDTGEKDDA